ncbi:MAG TPA: HAMP domain-containing sensor histidine kinase [Candidatus Saccharimonadales bacterium]|nr:HAMP domain-containing sensor histidine kinase [Candidatus Saccharimonadales bacterium]
MIAKLWGSFLVLMLMFAMAIAISMHKSFRSRLSVRIAVIILTVGPLMLFGFLGFNAIYYGSLHEPAPFLSRLLQVPLLILGGPLLLGLLAARYITKPLAQFNRAIASLKESNYQVELAPTGVREFDKVFGEFNDLIARLRQEEELRKNLISDTSHELNTPITAMLSQLTAMEEGVLPITKKRVHMLRTQTERLSDLVAQLTAYTKARSEPLLDNQEEIDLRSFCEDIADLFAARLKECGCELALDIPEGYMLRANRQALERMFVNLLQNAVRYANARVITVTAKNGQLRISDDGRGVPAESLPHLFERFYRVDPSRSRETGGLGLGLSIVRELAERQGWHIRAEDNKPGLAIVCTFSGADS